MGPQKPDAEQRTRTISWESEHALGNMLMTEHSYDWFKRHGVPGHKIAHKDLLAQCSIPYQTVTPTVRHCCRRLRSYFRMRLLGQAEPQQQQMIRFRSTLPLFWSPIRVSALRRHDWGIPKAPKAILSDRDPRFISDLWKGAFERMGTKLQALAIDGEVRRMQQFSRHQIRELTEMRSRPQDVEVFSSP